MAEQKWINGCGLAGCNPDYIVGRTVAAQGYGKGTVEAYKRKKMATDVFVINFGTGGGRDIQELKLRRTYIPQGVDFRLFDNYNPASPWKYGCDPAGLPERGWGEETKLTKPQVQAFQKLRGELQDVLPKIDAGQRDTRTDMMLLRFLRARNFEVVDSAALFRKQVEWRQTNNIDTILQRLQLPDMARMQALYPHGICGMDRCGRPVRIECIGRCDLDQTFAFFGGPDKMLEYGLYQNEQILAACAVNEGKAGHAVYDTTVIIDMDHGSLGKMRKAPKEFLNKYIQPLNDYYPETMFKTIVVNAPTWMKVAFEMVSPMLDVRTKQKVEMVSSKEASTAKLLEYIHPNQLPKFLGGEADTDLDRTLAAIDGGSAPPAGGQSAPPPALAPAPAPAPTPAPAPAAGGDDSDDDCL